MCIPFHEWFEHDWVEMAIIKGCCHNLELLASTIPITQTTENMMHKTFTLALLTTAAVSGFAPQTTSIQNKVSNSFSQGRPVAIPSSRVGKPLFMADEPNVEKQFEDLKEKFDKNTQFLVVDVEKARDDLAKNWGWIVGSGVLTMALGALALTLPVAATGVAYDGTVLTIGAAGVIGIINAIFAEKGHKIKSALGGLGYAGLSYYMATHPAQGLDIITLTIATVIAAEGLYETTLAVKNKNIQGRGWHFVSGIVSTAAGFLLSANIPVASLITPGAALGTRLTSSGASKVAIGLAGKDIADKRK